MQLFVAVTIIAILCFEVACSMIIYVVIQIILIKGHSFKNDGYYQTFETMEYLIPVFENIAHLCVILVFLGRFQHTFSTGLYYSASSKLIWSLYTALSLLFLCAIGIIVTIIIYHNSHTIIAIEILWEVGVEIMCLVLLYLFISRLYHLLRMSMDTHLKSNGKSSDFFDELTKTIKQSIHSSQEKSKSQSGEGKSRRNIWSKQSKVCKYVHCIICIQ